jgi:hypothetical protein
VVLIVAAYNAEAREAGKEPRKIWEPDEQILKIATDKPE